MSHTPGPWTIAWEDDDGEPYDNGVRIDATEGPVAFGVIDCAATLIAAAPELLAALKDLMGLYKQGQLVIEGEADEGDDPVVGAAFAAIAKAEGRGE